MKQTLTTAAVLFVFLVNAQNGYWQQRAYYDIRVDMDHNTHNFSAEQVNVYYNNSPDTLRKIYYHLYLNAFQPGSMMDQRSLNITDPDKRVGDRISKLRPHEEGWMKMKYVMSNGQSLSTKVVETTMEVELSEPLLPGDSIKLELQYTGQVPLQIRRNGRDNAEGVDYSMAQWYAKLCEYDKDGWHIDPYIGREFHGVWSDFDVRITMDTAFMVAATGVLQNPEKIGKGYGKQTIPFDSDRATWHFRADMVHDFAWGADRDYVHRIHKMKDGRAFHMFYIPDAEDATIEKNWAELGPFMEECLNIIERDYGAYPYTHYSLVQGGDGGMEYPMLTLIKGNLPKEALFGVSLHEFLHSWYHGTLATNELWYSWMDEGFTQFAQSRVEAEVYGSTNREIPYAHRKYAYTHIEGIEEPLALHADHYNTNECYGSNSYYKGLLFLHQLSYIIGEEDFKKVMTTYYDHWKFKHPTPDDFRRIAERVSGMQLYWYFNYWIETTRYINYAITDVKKENKKMAILLERKGTMPMPIDLVVYYGDGTQENIHIPMVITFGHKKKDSMFGSSFTVAEPWPWTSPTYSLYMDNGKKIEKVEIDPSYRMIDLEPSRHTWPVPKE